MLWLPAPCGFKDTWKVWLLSLDPTPERQQSRAGERRTLCDEAPSPDASGPSAVKTDGSEWRRAVMQVLRNSGSLLSSGTVYRTVGEFPFPDGNSPLCTQRKRVRAAGTSS